MKLLILLAAFTISTAAMASDFYTEMDKTFKKYALCNDEDDVQIDAIQKFKAMYQSLRRAERAGKGSDVRVTSFVQSQVALSKSSNGQDCFIIIDVYDGRCYSAYCNK